MCVRQARRVQAKPVCHPLLGDMPQEQEMGAAGHAELWKGVQGRSSDADNRGRRRELRGSGGPRGPRGGMSWATGWRRGREQETRHES